MLGLRKRSLAIAKRLVVAAHPGSLFVLAPIERREVDLARSQCYGGSYVALNARQHRKSQVQYIVDQIISTNVVFEINVTVNDVSQLISKTLLIV